MSGWATAELKNAQLGDVRRTKRLILIVDNLSKKSSATVPEACGTWAATKATYDFWDSPYIKPEQIRQAHIDSTLKRITEQDWILAIQDTTELNYTNHPATQGMGYLDSKYSRGLKVHSTIAVTIEGIPLGLINQQVWARNILELGKASTRHQKPTNSKESNKWLLGLRATKELITSGQKVVTIADREADFYDLFAACSSLESAFLIRATQNRCLMDSDQHLKEALEKVQPQGELIVELKRHLNRKARRAKLTIRFTSLTIKAPQNRPWPKHLAAINLQVILAVEEDPPLSEEPISWLLLTNLPISNCSQVIRYVKWYSYRWLIERYHYTLKSGCGLEKLQLRTARRLEMALATYSIVAWRLLWLTYQARCHPKTDCSVVLEPYEWQALYATIHEKKYPFTRPPTLGEVIGWIAQLGGFLGRKSDGAPGVKTLWRGLRRLDDIARTWLFCHNSFFDES